MLQLAVPAKDCYLVIIVACLVSAPWSCLTQVNFSVIYTCTHYDLHSYKIQLATSETHLKTNVTIGSGVNTNAILIYDSLMYGYLTK